MFCKHYWEVRSKGSKAVANFKIDSLSVLERSGEELADILLKGNATDISIAERLLEQNRRVWR